MELITIFANDPNSLTDNQVNELKIALIDVIKHKISKTEKKYNIKFKFPKNICDIDKKTQMPILQTPIIATPANLTLYAPLNVTVEDFSNEGNIDRLSTCLKIVNSVKQNLEDVEYGEKKKEHIDKTFFDWIKPTECTDNPIAYGSEIEEMYNKKFGNDELLNKLIKQLEFMQ